MKDKKDLMIIISGAVLLIAGLIIPHSTIKIILLSAAYLVTGIEVIFKAVKNIFRGKFFSESFLMSIATIGAICLGEYPEAVLVMLLYDIGEYLQDLAVDKSKQSISSLMSIRPDTATVYRNDTEVVVAPTEVEIGDTLIVKAGERIPLDGIVLSGSSDLDCMAITGESLPVSISPGQSIISGCINLSGSLKIKATKRYEDSAVGRILKLIQEEESKKAPQENFVSKFAAVYTPIVCILAVIIGIIVPLILNGSLSDEWLYRALSFLVASCPCALVISVPLAFYCGMGGASRSGILFKGSGAIELLSKTEQIAMDKTGTITEGSFSVKEINPVMPEYRDSLVSNALALESFSKHPIARSICRAIASDAPITEVKDVKEISGQGICGIIDGQQALAGNKKLMDEYGIACTETEDNSSIIHIAHGNIYLGYISVSDKIKTNAASVISALKEQGIKNIAMLTGDRRENAEEVAKKVGITSIYSNLLPDEKAKIINEMKISSSKDSKVMFIGDGINDAPVLTASDIGIAMGGIGSDAAVEAAGAVILHDDLAKIPESIDKSRKTMRIVSQNIIFSIAIKIGIILICAFGIAGMWAAVLADVGVTLLAVLNSLRLLGHGKQYGN